MARLYLAASATPNSVVSVSSGANTPPVVWAPAPSGDTTGVTDASALQSLLTAIASSGGTLVLKPGIYYVNAALTVASGVDVIGSGMGATTVRAVGNVFAFSFTGSHSRIAYLGVDAASAQVSTGGGFDFSSAGSQLWVEHIQFGSNLNVGINARPNTSNLGIYRFQHLRWNGTANSVYGILIGDGTHHVSDINISDVIATASAPGAGGVSQAWIALNFADTVNVTDSTFYQGTIGIQTLTTGTSSGLCCKGVVIDSMSNSGIQLSAYRDAEFADCHVQTCASGNVPALDIGAAGGTAVGFKWTGGTIQNNAGYGVIFRGASSHNSMVGAMVSDNNTSNTAFNDGIAIASGCLHTKIIGCTSGNNVLLATGHQVNGISTVGTADYYIIAYNDCPGNTTGVSDGASGTHKFVGSNL